MRSNRFMSVDHRRDLDRARVVYDDIDAAEPGSRLDERILHHRFVADVDHDRQGPAAGALDFFGGGIDGAEKLRVRFGGLCGDRNVGAVAGGAKRDRKPDAARSAGDEQCLSGKRHLRPHFLRERNASKAAPASSDFRSSLKCIASVLIRSTTSSRWPRISWRANATTPAGSAVISSAAFRATSPPLRNRP